MTFKLFGEYNTATVHTGDDRADTSAVEQISEMLNHEAFAARADAGTIAIMPDFHWGSGAVIGFTMPVKSRIVPNTIGVDIGCGMFAVNFGEVEIDDLEELDAAIRERVPTGFDVHARNDYHMLNDFPWEACREKLDTFSEQTDIPLPDGEEVYTDSYFNELCEQVEYDQGRAINSVGTLGGGNHFIELGRDSENNLWCVIHSGSRGIGANIAQHWQDYATERTFARDGVVEVPATELVYFDGNKIEYVEHEQDGVARVRPDSLEIDREAILEDYEGEAIEGKFGQLKSFMNAGKADASDLDYLEGKEAAGYIIDMVFAQTYASVSRKEMAAGVLDALRSLEDEPVEEMPTWWEDEVESVHNYIDFNDATIRKGACRAHDGERLVVPFNMKYGTVIARGKGESSWNSSSAHGAGRAMGRRDAKRRFDEDDFESQTEGVFMSKKPLDEIPGAYKNPEEIESALGENVEVVNRITPFLSVKAE